MVVKLRPHSKEPFCRLLLRRELPGFIFAGVLLSMVIVGLTSCVPMGTSVAAGDGPSRRAEHRQDPVRSLDSRDKVNPAGDKDWLAHVQQAKPSNHHDFEVVALFAVPGTRYAISVDALGSALIWDLDQGTARELIRLETEIDTTDFSPVAGLLALSRRNSISIYSVSTGKKVAELSRLRANATSVAFSPEGDSLLIGSSDSKVYRWRFADERTVQNSDELDKMFERYVGHSSIVSSVVYHPYGRLFFSGDWRGGVSAWLSYDSDAFSGQYDQNKFARGLFTDASNRAPMHRTDHTAIEKLVVTPDGEYVLVALQSGSVEFWSVRGLKKKGSAELHAGLIYDLSVSQDGTELATVGRDGRVRLWALSRTSDLIGGTPSLKATLDYEKSLPDVREVLAGGSGTVIAGGRDGKVYSLSVRSGE